MGKKYMAIVVVFLLALVPFNTDVNAAGIPAGRNIAAGKPAVANSNPDSAGYVTDGSENTFWAAQYNDVRQYVTVDLGQPCYLDRIEVVSRRDTDQPESRNDWTVSVSGGQYFFDAKVVGEKKEAGAFGSDLIIEPAAREPYRYIRVEAGLYLVIAEIRAFGTPMNPFNAAAGKTAEANSNSQAAGCVTDNDSDSYWAAQYNDIEQYVTVDLGGFYHISRIEVCSRRDVDQPESRDDWTVLASAGKYFMAGAMELGRKTEAGAFGSDLVLTPDASALYRYVRVKASRYLVVAEIRVFGEPEEKNVAAGKLAEANSNADTASAVTDSDFEQYWAAQYNDVAQWVTVDLGRPYALGRVEIISRRDVDQPESRNDWTVLASNDAAFSDPAVLGTKSEAGVFGSDLILSLDGSQTYRYIRVKASQYLVVSEVRAFEYNPLTLNALTAEGDAVRYELECGASAQPIVALFRDGVLCEVQCGRLTGQLTVDAAAGYTLKAMAWEQDSLRPAGSVIVRQILPRR